ncbi:7-cyano-7-deazaguanine synthase [Pseudomonas sp. IT-P4]|uniref:7-cyano-7-deazaguanine synthase n=1 Tax=Pseudomonas sp. IT-P4 TaxID=3026446 RepID=UPI0039DFF79E
MKDGLKRGLLLSGGMDSLALAWWIKPDLGITLDYGQLAAEAEISASKVICKRLGIDHHIISIDCRSVGSGDMAGGQADTHAPATDWWPYRNQMLVTLGAMKAISLGVNTLYLGTVKSDCVHRDGSQEFIDAISKLMAIQEGEMTVEAPAINLSTLELVRVSGVPRDMLAWAHSCHKSTVACGNCRGCNKYFEVWNELEHGVDQTE